MFELTSDMTDLDLREDFYTVLDGDTLWSIAAKFDIPVETLLALNTNIKSPNKLVPGEKVRLR